MPNSSRYERAKSVFLAALPLTGSAREDLLRQECGDDGELLADVRSLLDAEQTGGGRSWDDVPIDVLSLALSPAAPKAIGPYRVLSEIGSGGFGVVYLAERREPFVQRVAVKIIKPGMDSRAVIARFEQERQALAVMDHPNVAKVIDGGITPPELGSRPYFVMEHVQGEPINTFCDRHAYTLRQRLELFVQVCEAVQHAHHKGIIHRDLKPSNILVAIRDETAVPKVIDFGVAKAISQTLTDKTIFTEQGNLIGTPEYMSPEQAEMGAVDIDTRTDVYSLGVVLYELLSGMLPFDPKTLRSAGYDAIRRIIREQDPPKPSTRLTTADDAAAAGIAKKRASQLEGLGRELRRELDWIPLKALRKDRVERYRTPSDLADDIRRYLRGEALEAGPESAGYRLRKLLKRHRGPVVAASVVASVLVAGVVATALALNRALTAERGLRTQLAETAKAEQAERERADQLKQVSDFQSQMLGQIDATAAGVDLMKDIRERFAAALAKAGVPEADRTKRVDPFQQELVRVNATDTAAAMIDRTILKPAVKTIDTQFKDQPVVDAQLRQALADLYRLIGLYDAALPLQEAALSARRRVLGEEHPDTLQSTNNMGVQLRSQGKFAEAELYSREAMEKRRRVRGDEHSDTLDSINNMGLLLQAQGKLAEAEPYFREALEKRRRVLGEEHPDTLITISNMGALLRSQGKVAEAEPYYREALEKSRRVLGEEYPNTITAISNMGVLLRSQGKLAEAEPYYREALEKSRRVLGEEHLNTVISINNMGALLRSQGQFSEAEPYYREALEKCRRVLGEEHASTLTSINNMGFLLQAQDKIAEAEPYYREAMEKRRRILRDEHPDTLQSIHNMGVLLQAQGKHQAAIDLLLPSEPAARKAFTGSNARRLAGMLTTLGRARVGLGWGGDAERFAQAESNLLEAHAIYITARVESHAATLDCVRGLVDLYTAWNAAEPGKGYDAKAADWQSKLDVASPTEGPEAKAP